MESFVVTQSVLTLLIAAMSAYVAWSQWETAQSKLRLDLFERRFKIYMAAMNFTSSIISHGDALPENEAQYLRDIEGIQFIFGNDVADFFEENIWKKSLELNTIMSELSTTVDKDERAQKIKRRVELMTHFNGIHKEIDYWCKGRLTP